MLWSFLPAGCVLRVWLTEHDLSMTFHACSSAKLPVCKGYIHLSPQHSCGKLPSPLCKPSLDTRNHSGSPCPVAVLSGLHIVQASPTYKKVYGTAANKVTSMTSKVCATPLCDITVQATHGQCIPCAHPVSTLLTGPVQVAACVAKICFCFP